MGGGVATILHTYQVTDRRFHLKGESLEVYKGGINRLEAWRVHQANTFPKPRNCFFIKEGGNDTCEITFVL